jgi:hypothetical protein
VVIYDFNVPGMSRDETETNSPLSIDPKAVNAVAAFELFQPVRLREPELAEIGSKVDSDQLLKRFALNRSGQAPRELFSPNLFGFFARKTANHSSKRNAERYGFQILRFNECLAHNEDHVGKIHIG